MFFFKAIIYFAFADLFVGSLAESRPGLERLLARRVRPAPRDLGCPAIWVIVAAELRAKFVGCNNDARSAIRFAFHDAAGYSSRTPTYGSATGGADGSMLLSETEIARSGNNPMQEFRNNTLLPMYQLYQNLGVGAADLVQFAGAIGTRSCPGGPVYKTVVGRKDDGDACPDGTLPAAFGPNSTYSVLVQLFADKGFNERDVGALMGAHSVSRSFAAQQDGIPSGGPQDSTPNQWDMKYYQEIQSPSPPPGVYRFQSDVNLAQPDTLVGQAFTEFGNSFQTWAGAFSDAMHRVSILGIPQDQVAQLIDCTHLVY